MFFAVFLQINPKPKVATMSSRRPQGPLTWIVQFDCKTLANTTKFGNSSPDSIWQILQANLQSKSNLERLRQLLFEMAPGDPWIGNFYLKKSLNIFYLSCLKYNWLLVLEKNWSCGKMFLLLTRYHYWSDNIIDIEFWWFHEDSGKEFLWKPPSHCFFRQEHVQGFWVPDLLKTWQIHQRHPYLSIFTSKKHPFWGWYHKFMASWLRGLCLGSIKHSWIFQGSQKHRRVPVDSI